METVEKRFLRAVSGYEMSHERNASSREEPGIILYSD